MRESRVRRPSRAQGGTQVGVEGQECAGNPCANSSGLAVGAAAVTEIWASYLSAKPATTNGWQRWCARIRLENSFRMGGRLMTILTGAAGEANSGNGGLAPASAGMLRDFNLGILMSAIGKALNR